MAYEEPSLKQTLHEILNGLQSERNLRETNEGLQRLRQSIPGVVESVGRGAIASVPGSVGDISQFAREYAPETMQSTFGRRIAPTTREILDYVPRITPTHEGATTLENVGAAIAPGVGGVAKDVAMLTKGKQLGLSIMGPESALWKPEMAYQASKMESKGTPAEEILQKTGMVRGLDNQWRMELSDKFAKMKQGETFDEIHRRGGLNGIWAKENVLVKDVFEHPELMEAYPHLGDIKVKTHKADNPVRGSYNQKKNEISIREDLNPEEAKSVMLHELTHGIQAKEEFNRGANAGQLVNYYVKQKQDIMTKIEDLNRQGSEAYKADDIEKYRQLMVQRDVLSRRYTDMNPKELGYSDYLHHGGEAEARLVQRRANLSPEELRTNFPYQFTGKTGYGLDINPDEAIITTAHPGTINQPLQSIDLARKETLQEQFNKIAGGEKPVRSAVVMIGDKIFTGNTHTQAFEKAIQEGVVRKEGKKFIYPKGAEIDSDLFMLNDGSIVDRLTASRKLDVGSSEGALRDNLMQIRPANSMPVDEYMRQANEIKKAREAEKEVNYRGSHTAPYKTEDGTTAPGHELDKIYPPDVYGPKGHIYYGSSDQMDKDTLNILRSAKGNPDHPITVYRAVPKEYAGEDIHPGDWVTPNLDYAEQHGQYFENGHQILEKTVPAKHIYTEGNSLHEFGYDPTE